MLLFFSASAFFTCILTIFHNVLYSYTVSNVIKHHVSFENFRQSGLCAFEVGYEVRFFLNAQKITVTACFSALKIVFCAATRLEIIRQWVLHALRAGFKHKIYITKIFKNSTIINHPVIFERLQPSGRWAFRHSGGFITFDIVLEVYFFGRFEVNIIHWC